jgi:hypothetical protein
MEDDRIDNEPFADNRTILKTALIVVLSMVVAGLMTYAYSGFSEYQTKEDARKKAIINAVMDSDSMLPKTKMVDALSFVLTASGKYVKVGGWSCDSNIKDGGYDVWLNLTVNDNEEKLHWVVDKDYNLYPANDLAQKISVVQQLKM